MKTIVTAILAITALTASASEKRCSAFIANDSIAKGRISKQLTENGWKVVSNKEDAEITVLAINEKLNDQGISGQIFLSVESTVGQVFWVDKYSYARKMRSFDNVLDSLDEALKTGYHPSYSLEPIFKACN